MKKLCRLVLPVLLAVLAVSSSLAQDPQPRLRGAIREGARTLLANSRPPRALHGQDLGPIPDATPVPGITLVFRRSAAQEADLQALLADQQNSSSPSFHHWLTPESFGRRFGVADSDLDATRRWLTAQGFSVTGVSRAHDRITVSGSAAQVRVAFGATLHHYRVDNELHLAPASDLSLPADLAPLVTAVLHLSDFRPHPQAKAPARPRPAFTSFSTDEHFLTPKDLAVMYDTGSTYTGTGHSIAVVGQSFVNTYFPSAIGTFQTLATTNSSLYSVLVPGSGVEAISPGDAFESELDLEYSSGMAPGAHIYLVYVGSDPSYGVFDALAYAIDQNLAEVVSISYGQCETFLSATDVQQGTALLEQAALQGQTIVAATGDAGGTACAQYDTFGQFTTAEQQALTVEYPASSPLVTAVGGTEMAASTYASGPSPFWAPSPVNGDLVASLLSYVPEIAWNEGSANSGIFAGGGGASSAFPRPSWQTQFPGLPSGTTRILPDIAFQASADSPGFLLCSDDQNFLASEGQTSSCSEGLLGSNDQYTIAGGTSFAAPTFAGMVALLNQQQGSAGQGNLNPLLYNVAATSPSVFHDITTGSTACIPGAYRCGAPGQTGFAAAPGFDQATGLGSLDFGLLLAALPTPHSPSLETTLVQLTTGSDSVAVGGSDPFQISVGSLIRPEGETTPTGTVAVAVDGVVVDTALLLVPKPGTQDATVYYTFVGPSLAGSHLLTATYSGDGTHAPSSSTYPILVGNVTATGSISLTAGNITLPANGSTTSTVLVVPSGGYNGELLWSLAFVSDNGQNLTACYDIAPLSIKGNTSTTLALGTGTACSAPLPAARSSARPLSVHSPAGSARSASWRTSSAVTLSALLLCALVPSARRRSLALLCLLPVLAVALTTLSGCGGGGGSSAPAATSTSPGSGSPSASAVVYTFALTGTDSVNGFIQSSTNFTLTVQ